MLHISASNKQKPACKLILIACPLFVNLKKYIVVYLGNRFMGSVKFEVIDKNDYGY